MPKSSKKVAEAKRSTVALLPDEHLQALAADLKLCDQFGRLTVYAAVRVGLRVIFLKSVLPHGELEKTIKRIAPTVSETTMKNYRKVALAFLKDKKLVALAAGTGNDLDPKSAELLPILNEQLEMFSADETGAAHTVLKKLKEWVNSRTLTDIYRDLAEGGERSDPPTPKPGDSLADAREKQREALRNAWANFRKGFASGNWQLLPIDELKDLRADLKAKQAEIEKLLKQHNA